MSSTPTRSPNGICTAKKSETFGQYIQPDPSKVHKYFEDFDYYTAADWVVTVVEAGSGSASQALTDLDNGILLLTNDDADNDSIFLNKVGESFLFETGKKLWCEGRFALTDVIESDCVFGLQITDTTPLVVTDGVYFRKNDSAAIFDFFVSKNSVTTSVPDAAIAVNNVPIRLGFFYDGASEIKVFADGVHVGTAVTTNIPDDEQMTISFGVQNGEAAIKTMAMDYVFVAKER